MNKYPFYNVVPKIMALIYSKNNFLFIKLIYKCVFAVEKFQELSFWFREIRMQHQDWKKKIYTGVSTCQQSRTLSMEDFLNYSQKNMFQVPSSIWGIYMELPNMGDSWPSTATTTGQIGHYRAHMPIFSQLNCALKVYFKSSFWTILLKFLTATNTSPVFNK